MQFECIVLCVPLKLKRIKFFIQVLNMVVFHLFDNFFWAKKTFNLLSKINDLPQYNTALLFGPIKIFQVDSQYVFLGVCKHVNVFISKPQLSLRIAETMFIL